METIKRFGIAAAPHVGLGIWFDYRYFKSILIQLPLLTLRVSFSAKAARGVNLFNGFTN